MADRWWSFPGEAENGKTIIVTGRDHLEKKMESGKYMFRITVSWRYGALPNGMPDEESSLVLEQFTEAMQKGFHKNSNAVMTGIYTGDGVRDWIFYSSNLAIFSKVFNRALEELDTIPLEISAEEDPDWEEYRHMREETYIPEEED